MEKHNFPALQLLHRKNIYDVIKLIQCYFEDVDEQIQRGQLVGPWPEEEVPTYRSTAARVISAAAEGSAVSHSYYFLFPL